MSAAFSPPVRFGVEAAMPVGSYRCIGSHAGHIVFASPRMTHGEACVLAANQNEMQTGLRRIGVAVAIWAAMTVAYDAGAKDEAGIPTGWLP